MSELVRKDHKLEKMRLQKYIALCGICSRRKAEELIAEGKVSVDGKIVTEMGIKVDEDSDITVDGNKIRPDSKKYI